MSGKLTINRITDCKDLKIIMDDATIHGNFDSVDINDVQNCERASISMRNLKVVNSQDKLPAYRGSESPGSLTVNRIRHSDSTSINQDGIQISGNYDDVKVNDIEDSSRTRISMRGGAINVNGDSSSSESNDYSYDKHDDNPTKKLDSKIYDEDGLPRLDTHEYRIAPKFSVRIILPNTGTLKCSYLKKDMVANVVKNISDIFPRKQHPGPGRKQVCLVNEITQKRVDINPRLRLDEAGFYDGMELRAVEISDRQRGQILF